MSDPTSCKDVEGLLFDYLHFFGDYDHLQTGQGWYRREIRMIRNGLGIRSVRDAQFTGLATPARVSAFVILGALGFSALLWLWSVVLR